MYANQQIGQAWMFFGMAVNPPLKFGLIFKLANKSITRALEPNFFLSWFSIISHLPYNYDSRVSWHCSCGGWRIMKIIEVTEWISRRVETKQIRVIYIKGQGDPVVVRILVP